MAKSSAPENGSRATIRDVAARAGVSPATVSRVLIGNYPVASATKARVQRAMRELDYVVNAQARALSGVSRTGSVAFLVDNVTGAFYAHIARGVEQQATSTGRLCTLCTTDGDQDQVLLIIDLMREQNADVVVIVGGAWEDDEFERRLIHYAYALDRSGSRLALIGRPPLADPDAPATVVNYDNEGGAFSLTNHLLAAGHRRIVYLGQVPGMVTSRQRLDGFRRAHENHGFAVDPALILPGEFSREYGYQRTKALIAEGTDATAIMAATDVVAAGALRALHEAKIAVPGDIALVGYDDIPLAIDVYPSLTTVHVPQEELGRAAVRLALSRTKHTGPQYVVLGSHVVVRESAPSPGRSTGRTIFGQDPRHVAHSAASAREDDAKSTT